MTAERTGYALDNAAAGEHERLLAIEAAYDPVTRGHLTRLGVAPGAHVLLVGAGAGGVARWLAGEVGPAGRVVASDLDPRFLGALADAHDNVEAARYDVVADTLPAASFDVVHCRLVLEHLPEREQALANLASAVRPGGVLLVEDFDWASYGPAFASPGGEATIAAFTRFLLAGGLDARFGRRLPTLLRRLGMAEVDAVGTVLTLRGATSNVEGLLRGTFEQLVDQVIGAGLLSADDVAGFLHRFADPDYDVLAPTMMSAWGRRPT